MLGFRLRVRPQLASRTDAPAVRGAEEWDEVRALASRSILSSVLAQEV